MSDWQEARALALALPEAEEQPHFDKPSFRVRGKIFATLSAPDERLTLKLPAADQMALASLAPQACKPVAGYWGQQGWTEIHLRHSGSQQVRELLLSSWKQVAPKRLWAALESKS